MKKWMGPLRRLVGLPLALLALAIGTTQGGGGVTGTGGVAFGSIDDFGSIFVNGVEYFLDTANITIDGVPGRSESQLRVGMIVKVDGVLLGGGTTGQASSVAFNNDVRGTIDSAPVVSDESVDFTVDGVPVHAGDGTFVDGALSAALLAAGDRVDVSGLPLAGTGVIAASRIARSAVSGTILTGAISNLTPSSFNLGSVLVTYDAGALNGVALANGKIVRVRSGADPANGTLAADSIQVPDGTSFPAGSEVDTQGVVSNLTSTSFFLGGLRVTYNSSVKFSKGTIANLQNGDTVEVGGTIAADGSLTAKAIQFQAFPAGRVDGRVVAKTSNGFFVIFPDGVQVVINTGSQGSTTRFHDRSSLNQSNLGLATLQIGDYVDVTGSETSDGVITADVINRLNPVPGVSLDWRVRGADATSVRLLSIHAVATGSTVFRDADGTALTADQFFGKAAGRRVTVNGVPSGTDVLASSFQIDP